MDSGESINKTKAAIENPKVEAMKFTKEQILEAKKYRNRRDLVGALIEDGGMYSISEVDAAISDFMKRKVK